MATVPLNFPIVRITIGLKLQDNKSAAIMVTITFKIVIASVTITNKFCITNNESLMKNIKNSWFNSNSFYLKGVSTSDTDIFGQDCHRKHCKLQTVIRVYIKISIRYDSAET